MHHDQATYCRVSPLEATGHASPPVENPTCAAFEDYGEVQETVSLNFMEDEVTWVASKLSSAAGALGAEAVELINWIIQFGCELKDLRVVIAKIYD